ncbi:MAG: hypothetical protein IM669_06865 [Phenylobacterium sp.]|uniref:hypothetical protein n=1 Tax=Phenylobacterium sp. TaxID=1871053 RepID=UPI0025DD018D|nr:hypothetical protein [Phenylobacterium sp.]MCA3757232.1 hypothetical protein [Phenylobacterium sp.]
MPKGLSASTIKSWFQYRCERKVRYELSSDEELAAVPVVKDVREQAWAILGQDFEERVVRRLQTTLGVLRPAPGDRAGLSERLATAFLKGVRPEPYAAQINLRTRRPPKFLEGTGLSLSRTFPDLIRLDRSADRLTFTVIDIKATRHATPFHKTQVAFYVRVLEEFLREIGMAAELSPMGEIWRIPDDGTGEGDGHQAEVFTLAPYLRLVDEFCRDVLPGIAAKQVRPGYDDTFFHIYFKCEQCSFLEHCQKSIAPELAANRRDVSAVTGLTHEAKRVLQRLDRGSVQGLATAAGFAETPGLGWSLSRRAPQLIKRARALADNRLARTDEQQTFLMPPKADEVLLLSVDQDPVDDRLAAVGYRRVRNGAVVREAIEVPATAALKDEANAMAAVLGPLIEDLTDIDAANASAGGDGIFAHIFLYEPSEAINLQRAVGRHLEDDRIRGGLLHLVRLFPPEEVVPEPEFRGMHHLPATAVRSVVEQLYALPVSVAYDLRQVSAALAQAGGGPAYAPQPGFERPFSSLLSIDVIRNLRDKRPKAKTPDDIKTDVRARLDALSGVIGWLFRQNEAATAAGAPLLRLAKKPFRFQATFDPLNAVDLDVLLACELLESRAGLLDALIKLAEPAARRRDAGRCFAGLKLVSHRPSGGIEFLNFRVPPESQQAELGPGAFNLILTQDEADLRLDPRAWPAVSCRIQPPGQGYETRRELLSVSMNRAMFNGPVMQELLRNPEPRLWHIDQAFGDLSTAKAVAFLTDLVSAR